MIKKALTVDATHGQARVSRLAFGSGKRIRFLSRCAGAQQSRELIDFLRFQIEGKKFNARSRGSQHCRSWVFSMGFQKSVWCRAFLGTPMASSSPLSAISLPHGPHEYIIPAHLPLRRPLVPSFLSIVTITSVSHSLSTSLSWSNSILASPFFSLSALPLRHVPPLMA